MKETVESRTRRFQGRLIALETLQDAKTVAAWSLDQMQQNCLCAGPRRARPEGTA